MQLHQAGAFMRRAEIETLARRWIGFWQDGSLQGFDAVKTEDFIDHSAAGHDADREGLRAAVAAPHRAFPDLEARPDLITVDVSLGLATIRWTATGTHEGEFLGLPPSGRLVRFHGIEVIRCSDGVVVERWGEWDEGAILTQLAGFPLAAE